MKKNCLLTMLCTLVAVSAQALTVSVDGYGSVPAEGMEITLSEAEEDPFTGDMVMGLTGTLESAKPVRVTITRSAAGLNDEFCCAGQCVPGNGEVTERLDFTPGGEASWFVHYFVQANENQTVTYTFSTADEDPLTVTVHFNAAQGTESIRPTEQGVRKVLQDGIIYLIHDNKKHTIL